MLQRQWSDDCAEIPHRTPLTAILSSPGVLTPTFSSAPAWSGMCSATDRARLDSLLRRSKRLGYCNDDLPAVADLFSTADDEFFRRVKSNSTHVLHPYLPVKTDIPYQLRTRSHCMTLINNSSMTLTLLFGCSTNTRISHCTMFYVRHINGHFSLFLANMFLSLVTYDNL